MNCCDSYFLCALTGPEADRVHPVSAEPAGERHQADAQSHGYSEPASKRGTLPAIVFFSLDFYFVRQNMASLSEVVSHEFLFILWKELENIKSSPKSAILSDRRQFLNHLWDLFSCADSSP